LTTIRLVRSSGELDSKEDKVLELLSAVGERKRACRSGSDCRNVGVAEREISVLLADLVISVSVFGRAMRSALSAGRISSVNRVVRAALVVSSACDVLSSRVRWSLVVIAVAPELSSLAATSRRLTRSGERAILSAETRCGSAWIVSVEMRIGSTVF